MRDAREILRQKWLLDRSYRAVAESLGVGVGVVGVAMRRAADASLDWDPVDAMDDAELERRLCPAVVAASRRPEPDCANAPEGGRTASTPPPMRASVALGGWKISLRIRATIQ